MFSDLISIIDQYKLEVNNKQIKDNKINSYINSQLNRVGLDEKFLECMIESKGIISGFFITQCFKNKWKKIKTDVDIFIVSDHPAKTVYPVGSVLKEDAQQLTAVENWLWKKINYDTKKFTYSSYATIGKTAIDIVRQYELDKIVVQVIHVNTKDITKFINENFDFEFLINIYDGSTLKILNLESIRNESSKYLLERNDTQPYTKRHVKDYRCMKYVERNFKIIGYEPITEVIIIIEKVHSSFMVSMKGNHYHGDYVGVDSLYKLLKIKDFIIKYEYRGKIYGKEKFKISSIDNILEKQKTPTQKRDSKNIFDVDIKYFPESISNIVSQYRDIGKKRYNNKDLTNRKKRKQFLLNILEYLDKFNDIYEINEKKNKREDNHPSGLIYRTMKSSGRNNNPSPLDIYSRNFTEGYTLCYLLNYFLTKSLTLFEFRELIYADSNNRISIEEFIKWQCLSKEVGIRALDETELKIEKITNRRHCVTIDDIRRYIKKM